MKKKTTYSKAKKATPPAELKEAAAAYHVEEPMVRTQIYLSRLEYDFVQTEASRRGEPMAAVIRAFIDEKMEIPDEMWSNNPMLDAAPHDPEWQGREDGAINHDHYIHGGPKKWIKVKGRFVEAPPVPEDYYSNPKSAEVYDLKIRETDESQ